MSWYSKYIICEKKVSYFLKQRSITFLGITLGIVYFWYGLLKVLGISPVEELVIRSTSWIFSPAFVHVLGVWEMLIGIFFLLKPLRRLGIWLFFFHLPGTFLPLFINPEDCFTVFPYGLTLEGQFILKNLVSLAAVFVIISDLHQKKIKMDYEG